MAKESRLVYFPTEISLLNRIKAKSMKPVRLVDASYVAPESKMINFSRAVFDLQSKQNFKAEEILASEKRTKRWEQTKLFLSSLGKPVGAGLAVCALETLALPIESLPAWYATTLTVAGTYGVLGGLAEILPENWPTRSS